VLTIVRFALQCVLFFLILGAVIGFASSETGMAEKFALAALIVVLVYAAVRLRRYGAAPSVT
jgi:hypothetical protein